MAKNQNPVNSTNKSRISFLQEIFLLLESFYLSFFVKSYVDFYKDVKLFKKAVKDNDKDLIEKILNTKSPEGNTLIHSAVHHSNRSLIKFLVKNGANVNEKNNQGQTALHIASQMCNHEFIKILLDNKALVNERDKKGDSALSLAIKSNNMYMEYSRLTTDALLKGGADINLCDSLGITPFHLTLKYQIYDPMELIAKGANVTIKDSNGNTALHYLAGGTDNIRKYYNSDKHVVKLIENFIKSGVEVNAINSSGESALHSCAYNSNTKLSWRVAKY